VCRCFRWRSCLSVSVSFCCVGWAICGNCVFGFGLVGGLGKWCIVLWGVWVFCVCAGLFWFFLFCDVFVSLGLLFLGMFFVFFPCLFVIGGKGGFCWKTFCEKLGVFDRFLFSVGLVGRLVHNTGRGGGRGHRNGIERVLRDLGVLPLGRGEVLPAHNKEEKEKGVHGQGNMGVGKEATLTKGGGNPNSQCERRGRALMKIGGPSEMWGGLSGGRALLRTFLPRQNEQRMRKRGLYNCQKKEGSCNDRAWKDGEGGLVKEKR